MWTFLLSAWVLRWEHPCSLIILVSSGGAGPSQASAVSLGPQISGSISHVPSPTSRLNDSGDIESLLRAERSPRFNWVLPHLIPNWQVLQVPMEIKKEFYLLSSFTRKSGIWLGTQLTCQTLYVTFVSRRAQALARIPPGNVKRVTPCFILKL